mmetsp:Transcript_10988/g.7658  ORF Transcript_10988/g.7658 Transcript_10988/m.7658 type:complete len:139 (-) Transcript_10988:524-940(-)
MYYFDFFHKTNLYGVIYGMAFVFGGIFCNIFGSYLADRFEPVNYKTKPLLGIGMSLIAIPCFIGAFLTQFSFYFCIACIVIELTLAEAWNPITIAMAQASVHTKLKGLLVSLYLALQAIAVSLFLFGVGKLNDLYGHT